MILVVFGVGVFVFFLTVYGTVVAGGLMLTKEQIDTTGEPSADPRPDIGENSSSPGTMDRADREVGIDSKVEI
jgi:hypothetical protein